LGGTAQGTVRLTVTPSTLPAYPDDLVAGAAHVRALAERFAHYAVAVRTNSVHAADVEDTNTASLCTDISRGIETRLGGLDAYLHG
jgi:starvation-inducible DNA-binding protein